MRSLTREFIRKLFHLPVFAFPFIALYSMMAAIVALLVLAIGYLTIVIYQRQSARTVPFFSAVISLCSRDSAYDLGPLYLALGMIAALLIGGSHASFFAAYVIAVCDSAASLIGMRFGRHSIPVVGKSYLGSFAFFVTCFLGGLYFLPPLSSLVAASCLTLIEIVSIRGLDNLTLPVASQMLLMSLS